MPPKPSTPASLGAVALAAQVSKATASLALRNSAGPSKQTRERVLKIAHQMGYVPDARMAMRMGGVAEAKSKDLLPIAWLNSNIDKDVWRKFKFHSPYIEGAAETCQRYGYRLEEIWIKQPGMTMRRIAEILYQRGIQAVIVSAPITHLRLKWDHLAGVGIGGALLAPRLPRIDSNSHFNLLLALKMVRRLGYERIGICLAEQADRFTHRVMHATADHFYLKTPKAGRIPPIFYAGEADDVREMVERQIHKWLRLHRPQVVVGSTSHLLPWIQGAGFRVPDEVGLVHVSLDEDLLDWAGIHSNKREIGRVAAAQVISNLQNRQFGIPAAAPDILLQGKWQSGWTLPGKPTLGR